MHDTERSRTRAHPHRETAEHAGSAGPAQGDVQGCAARGTGTGLFHKHNPFYILPELQIPRDRNGEYEPQIIRNHERNITGLEEKVLSLYAAGMSTRDIHDQIKGLYGVEISAELVSRITDKVLPLVSEWQNRPLEKVYPFVFMDAVHYKVRDDKTVVTKAAYVVLGVNLEGYKEILGIYVGTNESSKYWLGILNELKNRGVQNVLLFCGHLGEFCVNEIFLTDKKHAKIVVSKEKRNNPCPCLAFFPVRRGGMRAAGANAASPHGEF